MSNVKGGVVEVNVSRLEAAEVTAALVNVAHCFRDAQAATPQNGDHCPEWFMQANPEPRTFVEPPQIPLTGIGAPNHDGLGRYVGPARETRTAERQFADATKGKRGFWR